MLQADVTAARWQQDSDGAWLCLRVQSPASAMAICDEMKPDKQYVAQIKRAYADLRALWRSPSTSPPLATPSTSLRSIRRSVRSPQRWSIISGKINFPWKR